MDDVRSPTTPSRPAAVAVAIAITLLVAVGCSSAVKSKVADIADKAACTAITSVQSAVQDKVTGTTLQVLSDDQITQIQNASSSATKAIDALGSKLPSNLSSQLDQAQAKLDSAVNDKQASVEQRRANVRSAVDEYLNKLDSVKSNLGC